MEEAQASGLCMLVSFIGAMDPTNAVMAIIGSMAVREAIIRGLDCHPYMVLQGILTTSYGGMAIKTRGIDSEHVSKEVLVKICPQSNLAP